MKFLVCTLALVAAAVAAPPYYNPGYPLQHVPQPISREGSAQILRQASVQNPDGGYSWSYETDNGISAAETNSPQSLGPHEEPSPNVEGGYQYTSPDGQVIQTSYKAGAEGFVAQGAHLPVAPPIPEEILRSLAWNAAHPEEEQQWDPAYNKPVAQPIYNTGR